MRSLFLSRLLLAGIVALAANAALAEKLEYKQCVATALAQNPDLAISRAQIEQAEAAVRQAQGNKMPRVNLSLTATRSNDALNAFGLKLGQQVVNPATDFGPTALNHPDAVNNFNTRIELLVPVYNGGMVQSYVDTAKAYVRAAQSGDEVARQQLTKHVLMAYQGVHTARAYIKLADEARVAAEEYVRISDRLY